MTAEGVKSILVKYIAPFVEHTTEEAEAIKTAISQAIASLWSEIIALPGIRERWPVVTVTADEEQIIRGGGENEGVLRSLLRTRYILHQLRGSRSQIAQDIRRFMNNDTVTVEIYGEDQCGWWLDRTYPDIGNTTFLDAFRLCVITGLNKSSYDYKTARMLMKRHFIPVEFTVIHVGDH